ncbi:hypothetical protein FXO38_31312 [Capsicum annuum]|nr:hypothetical protein FXO38_31312 [Capsicum annuum]KAF3631431.1 hypothetical protein FXO37_27963 [Capsicum annuum]
MGRSKFLLLTARLDGGLLWFHNVWYGVVWYGIVWYGTVPCLDGLYRSLRFNNRFFVWFDGMVRYGNRFENEHVDAVTKGEPAEVLSGYGYKIKSGRTIQLESLCDLTKDEELQDNASPVSEPSSSGSTEEARPNGNKERAGVLKSSGSMEEVRPNGNEERAAAVVSSRSTEKVRQSAIKERAAELASSGNKVEGDSKGTAKAADGSSKRDEMQPGPNSQLAHQGSFSQE